MRADVEQDQPMDQHILLLAQRYRRTPAAPTLRAEPGIQRSAQKAENHIIHFYKYVSENI
jgi:hypothetical protein